MRQEYTERLGSRGVVVVVCGDVPATAMEVVGCAWCINRSLVAIMDMIAARSLTRSRIELSVEWKHDYYRVFFVVTRGMPFSSGELRDLCQSGSAASGDHWCAGIGLAREMVIGCGGDIAIENRNGRPLIALNLLSAEVS